MIAVRQWARSDIPEVVRLGGPRFAGRAMGYDAKAAAADIDDLFAQGAAIPFRTDHAFGLGVLGMGFAAAHPTLEEKFVFSTQPAPWEVMAIYRAFAGAAKRAGAADFQFGTSTDSDVGVIARRLGARPIAYAMEVGSHV